MLDAKPLSTEMTRDQFLEFERIHAGNGVVPSVQDGPQTSLPVRFSGHA